jgi:hypothetical protein
LYNRCRLTEEPVSENYWPIDESIIRRCSKMKYSGFECPEGTYCGNPLEFGIPL